MHTRESLPYTLMTRCFYIYTSSSITPLKKLVFTLIWCIIHPIYEAICRTNIIEVDLWRGENVNALLLREPQHHRTHFELHYASHIPHIILHDRGLLFHHGIHAKMVVCFLLKREGWESIMLFIGAMKLDYCCGGFLSLKVLIGSPTCPWASLKVCKDHLSLFLEEVEGASYCCLSSSSSLSKDYPTIAASTRVTLVFEASYLGSFASDPQYLLKALFYLNMTSHLTTTFLGEGI